VPETYHDYIEREAEEARREERLESEERFLPTEFQPQSTTSYCIYCGKVTQKYPRSRLSHAYPRWEPDGWEWVCVECQR